MGVGLVLVGYMVVQYRSDEGGSACGEICPVSRRGTDSGRLSSIW
jgi:hypothetical protein